MRCLNRSKTVNLPVTHFTEEETGLKKRVCEFAEAYVVPLVFAMDRQGELDQELMENLFKHGLMNLEIPREYGGYGGSFLDTVLAVEELGRYDPAVGVFIDVQNVLVNNALLHWGTETQKKRYLPKLADHMAGSFSITEKEAGSDAYALSCHAEQGDGGFFLSGEKHWATNSAEADLFIIFAKVGANQSEITAFLVERDSPGFTVGCREEKMGIRASSTCDLFLDRVFVPEQNVLGGIGSGRRMALELLTDGRIGIAAQMIGLARGAFDAAVKHARFRKQFGKSIADFQGVHFPIAEMATDIEAARGLVYNAVRLKMCSHNFGDYFTAASMAKLFASKVAEHVSSRALDILGGKGYMKGDCIEKFYRDAKIGKIYEGTTNMQLSTIARKYVKVKTGEI